MPFNSHPIKAPIALVQRIFYVAQKATIGFSSLLLLYICYLYFVYILYISICFCMFIVCVFGTPPPFEYFLFTRHHDHSWFSTHRIGELICFCVRIGPIYAYSLSIQSLCAYPTKRCFTVKYKARFLFIGTKHHRDVCIVGRRRRCRNRWPTRTDFEMNPEGPRAIWCTFSYKVKYLHETFSILFQIGTRRPGRCLMWRIWK